MYTLSICALFKDEAPYLIEWIEYHLLVGVEHFFLYNHESSDQYAELLAPYVARRIVELRDWPSKKGDKNWVESQKKACQHCIGKARGQTKWLAIIDLDEFLLLVLGGDLLSFLAPFDKRPWIGGIQVRWQLYGTSGLSEIPKDQLLIESLIWRAPSDYASPFGPDNQRVKSIVRPETVASFDIHTSLYKQGFIGISEEISSIRINHYWTRSEKYFHEVKLNRRLEFSPTPPEAFLEKLKDLNQVLDPIVMRYVPKLRERVFSSLVLSEKRKELGWKQRMRSCLPSQIVRWGGQVLRVLRYLVDGGRCLRDLCSSNIRGGKAEVVLCLACPGSVGGTEFQVEQIGERLHKRGGRCLVLVCGELEEGRRNRFLIRLKELGIPVMSMGKLGLSSFWNEKRREALFRFVAPKGRVCHFFNPVSTVLAQAAKTRGFQVVYTETGMPDEKGGWEILRKTLSCIDSVTSVSQAGLNALRRLYNYAGPAQVIPTVVESLKQKRQGSKEFHLIYFGRMTPLKGVDRLLRSFAQLVKVAPEARLSLVGSGEALPDLKAYAKALGVIERVEFTGWMERNELMRYLGEVDLFCLPSETEGLPGSILEAMSIGLAVVASDVGGVSEIIEQGVSGVLIPPGDEKALTAALLELSRDRALRERLGMGALASWEKRGGKEEILRAFEAIYGME
jgi:glycosyltransferase involved in cell wall biosynthesis